MGRMQRNKGANAERYVAEKLLPLFPAARRRCTGEETQDDHKGRDLDGVSGYCVQVQAAAKPTPEKKWQQADKAKSLGEVPIAIVRRQSKTDTGNPWLVVIPFEDFIKLLEDQRASQCRQCGSPRGVTKNWLVKGLCPHCRGM